MDSYPRCETCKHWTRFERTEPGVWHVGGNQKFAIELPVYRGDDGECSRLPVTAKIDVDHIGCHDHFATGYFVTTDQTFGCVLHEPKEPA